MKTTIKQQRQQSQANRSNVKRIAILGMLSLICVLGVSASIQKIELSFNESDFDYVVDASTHNTHVECPKSNATYPGKGLPALPLLSENILLKPGHEYVSTKVTYIKRVVKERVTLDKCKEQLPTDISIGDSQPSGNEPYAYDFPDSVYMLSGISPVEGYQVLHYVISPYEYVRSSGTLYFIDKMTLEIETKDLETSSGSSGLTMFNHELVGSLVNNTAVLDHDPLSTGYSTPIDYLLITSDALADSFQPLLDWKHVKGLRVAVRTVEEIDSRYTGSDLPYKIKRCIQDFHNYNGVRFVLLGGDTEVVPTRYCIMPNLVDEKSDPQAYTIPTDKYYACLGKNFNWDKNGNGIYGEPEDDVDLMDDVYLTRIPVNTPTDAYNVSMKFVESEKDPKWNGNMLMAGSALWDYAYRHSDAEYKGDRLFNEHIEPYLEGNKVKFFDTGTDFEEGARYDLTPYNLYQELCKGYSFVEYIGHGSCYSWYVENNEQFKSWPDAERLVTDINTTVITTCSCSTNYFDCTERSGFGPCLSETFIRNVEGGVVAYFGCSRAGFGTMGPISTYGTSLRYDASFYDMLFSDRIINKNFGKIATLAKLQRVGLVLSDALVYEDGWLDCRQERWVQFGQNPVGDPEMPLFTATPKTFDNAKCTVTMKPGLISSGVSFVTTIDTGEDDCRVCITSEEDNGERVFKVYDNVRTVSCDGMLFDCIATITKQNFKPKQIYAYNKSAAEMSNGGGKILSCDANSEPEKIALSLQIPESVSDVKVVVSDYELGSQTIQTLSKGDLANTSNVPVSIVKEGTPKTHVVSLVIDGQVHDSINVLK